MTGHKGFISLSPWPSVDEGKIDVRAEENEALIMNVLEDTQNITKATGFTPKEICYYTAAEWKWKAYLKALENSMSAKVMQKDLMKELMQDPALKGKAAELARFTSQIVDEINRMPEERRQRLVRLRTMKERQTLEEAKKFIEKEFDAKICVYEEEEATRYDPKDRARLAKPYRPAIFIE